MSGFHIDAFFEAISKENTQGNQMNTHDIDIELPPLPTPPSLIQRKDWYGAIQAYARSYGKECARAAIEADRKRMEEPVGYFYPWELERSLKAYPNGFPGAVAVFAAPQPAEPSRGEPVLVGWTVSTTGGGILHASKYTECEAKRLGYSLPVYRLTSPQPTEPVAESERVYLHDKGYPEYLDGAQCQYVIERGKPYPHGDPVAFVYKKEDAERIVAALNNEPRRCEPVDKGPWKAGVNRIDKRTFIQSDDFTHDVRLYVDGDFADQDEKLAYALGIADQLNAALQPAEPVKDGTPLGKALDGINSYFASKKSDEPVSRTYWNSELSSWSDEDFIRIFHERPDLASRLRKILAEPVKTLVDNQEPLGEEFQRVLDEHGWDLYVKTTEPVNAPHATTYCQHPHCQTTGGCQGPCYCKR